MSTRLRFLAAAAFEIVGPESRVLIDPFLTGNPVAPLRHEDLEAPDLILVTHAAFDHLGDAAAIAARTGAPIVCGGDVRRLLLDDGVPSAQIMATVWGVVVEVAGIVVRPVECHHWSMSTRANGQVITGTPLAFMFNPEPGVTIYHYGDTSIFDMRLIGSLYAPTVGLIGCSQPRGLAEMNQQPESNLPRARPSRSGSGGGHARTADSDRMSLHRTGRGRRALPASHGRANRLPVRGGCTAGRRLDQLEPINDGSDD